MADFGQNEFDFLCVVLCCVLSVWCAYCFTVSEWGGVSCVGVGFKVSPGPPKISLFFCPLPPQILSFLLSLGVLSLNCGGVFEGRDPQMCTFGVLRLSDCGGRREKKSEILGGQMGFGFSSGFWGNSTVTKLRERKKSRKANTKQREKSKREKKQSKNHLFDFGQFRLRPISTSASWPKSNCPKNWPKSSIPPFRAPTLRGPHQQNWPSAVWPNSVNKSWPNSAT